jgi:phasin
MSAMNDTMTASTVQATDLIKSSYSTVAKGSQDYNNKIIEFARTNTNAAFDFLQQLSGVKSPSEFMELSTAHAQKQFEVLSTQTKELAAFAQKVTLATTEPLKAGITKAINKAG